MCLRFYSGASAESPPGPAARSRCRLRVSSSAACPASPPPSPPGTGWAGCSASASHPSSSSSCPSKVAPSRPASTHRALRAGEAASLCGGARRYTRRTHERWVSQVGALLANLTPLHTSFTVKVSQLYAVVPTDCHDSSSPFHFTRSLSSCSGYLPWFCTMMATAADKTAKQSGTATRDQEKAIQSK